jgi:hypothetical protein
VSWLIYPNECLQGRRIPETVAVGRLSNEEKTRPNTSFSLNATFIYLIEVHGKSSIQVLPTDMYRYMAMANLSLFSTNYEAWHFNLHHAADATSGRQNTRKLIEKRN